MKRTVILILAFCGQLLYPLLAICQGTPFDPVKTVIPISKVKIGIGAGVGAGIGPTFHFGTAFCLNLNCRFVATNYHVAIALGSSPKIQGEKVAKKYLATSADDEGATFNEMLDPFAAPMKYNLSRDFAIFELMHPLGRQGMRGVTFSLDELEESQEVDIYAYPMASRLIPIRTLTKFPGKFVGESQEGILAFKYEPSERGQSIKPGASGGLIIDRKTQQAVAVLIGVAKDDNIAVAVSVQSLADFVKSINPDLYAELFPAEVRGGVRPANSLADIYPKYEPPAVISTDVQYRLEESEAIQHLRRKAQDLADSIKDFIAVQTVEYGGMKRVPAPSQYEVQVIDGRQQFREYPDGKTQLREIPLPLVDPVLGPGGEWSTLPTLVGTALKLRMMEAPDAVIGGRRVKVFKYRGDIEDAVCGFRHIIDYLFFQHEKEYPVSCNGEVWADEDFNIIRISENDDLPPATKWRNLHAVVTYGWLDNREGSRRVIPVTFAVQAEFKGMTYWCQGRFTNYRVFTAKARLIN